MIETELSVSALLRFTGREEPIMLLSDSMLGKREA
jgi:hypothetical protein